jgi:hypothetical protein
MEFSSPIRQFLLTPILVNEHHAGPDSPDRHNRCGRDYVGNLSSENSSRRVLKPERRTARLDEAREKALPAERRPPLPGGL